MCTAIEPKTKADVDKMGMALAKLAEEDPTFTVRTDEVSKLLSQVWVSFLDILVDRMRREFKVEVNQGELKLNTKKLLQKLLNTEKHTRNNLEVVVNSVISYLD
jgi:elongation factor G